jgi:hypothetical protein
MVYVILTFELTDTQTDALRFEAKHTNVTVEELMAWMVRENIVPLLDVIDADGNKQQLLEALQDEELKERDSHSDSPKNPTLEV